MDDKTFNSLVHRRILQIQSTLTTKGKEYGQKDRLHNFKVAARIDEVEPEVAAWGMAKKHLVSVMDMIEGRQIPTRSMIDEKVGDMINYLILIEALLNEKPLGPE
ncbi:MAG: hypothetical protein ACPKM1_15740 [Spirochaetaceae bacterium]